MPISTQYISTLIASGRVEDAIKILDDYTSLLEDPYVCVLKGECLQLSEDGPLSDVEDAITRAIALDDHYAEAHLELGWFYYYVFDDCQRAEPCFDRAISLLMDQLIEGLSGAARCAAEQAGDSAVDDLILAAIEEFTQRVTREALLRGGNDRGEK